MVTFDGTSFSVRGGEVKARTWRDFHSDHSNGFQQKRGVGGGGGGGEGDGCCCNTWPPVMDGTASSHTLEVHSLPRAAVPLTRVSVLARTLLSGISWPKNK